VSLNKEKVDNPEAVINASIPAQQQIPSDSEGEEELLPHQGYGEPRPDPDKIRIL
jgi:hypothetical protein